MSKLERIEQIRKRLQEISEDDHRDSVYQDQLDTEREDLEVELAGLGKESFPVDVLGTIIGTATGWDEVDVNHQTYYEFEANKEFTPLNRPAFERPVDMSLNLNTGVIETYNEDGEVMWKGQLRLLGSN